MEREQTLKGSSLTQMADDIQTSICSVLGRVWLSLDPGHCRHLLPRHKVYLLCHKFLFIKILQFKERYKMLNNWAISLITKIRYFLKDKA
jgi:hypothetical protein